MSLLVSPSDWISSFLLCLYLLSLPEISILSCCWPFYLQHVRKVEPAANQDGDGGGDFLLHSSPPPSFPSHASLFCLSLPAFHPFFRHRTKEKEGKGLQRDLFTVDPLLKPDWIKSRHHLHWRGVGGEDGVKSQTGIVAL